MLGTALLKKLTIVGGLLSNEKRYLLKEMLVVAVFSVCCLGINSVILWPAAVAVGMLPLSLVLIDLVAPKVEEKCITKEEPV